MDLEAQETLAVVLLQSRREPGWRDSLRRVALLLEGVDSRLRGAALFLNENWLSREPIALEDYQYAIETLGRYHDGPIFAGTNYVVESGEAKSVGLALIGGRLRRACEKVFPSKAVGERGRIAGGRVLPPVEISGWRISCIVCVDIFYPELARIAVLQGADIIYNPASIPNDRLDLWRSILLARAAESTVFTVGVNSVGYVYPDGRITLGGSAVHAPNGTTLGVMGSNEGTLGLTLDRSMIARIRERWAFYDDLTGPLRERLYGDPVRLAGSRFITI